VSELAEIADGPGEAHLGSGASMCALAGGRSIESTMGFTALEGLPDIATRGCRFDLGQI
jgi:acetate kinase